MDRDFCSPAAASRPDGHRITGRSGFAGEFAGRGDRDLDNESSDNRADLLLGIQSRHRHFADGAAALRYRSLLGLGDERFRRNLETPDARVVHYRDAGSVDSLCRSQYRLAIDGRLPLQATPQET